MERYSFGTYLVDEFNQEAFSLCHDIANLKSDVRQPVTIIGDTGTGKTHLLYSIIGHIRATTAATGLAYVNANEFPRAVRDLVTHPRPVEEATSAILLVDDLDRFKLDLDILASVIRLFLDNGHYVVCASRMHLSRLQQLPGGLAHILDNGHRVTIAPKDSPTRIELLENSIRAEHDEVITRLENELSELRNFLTSASETHGEDGDDESLLLSLRKELELTRTELKLLQTKQITGGGNVDGASVGDTAELLEELEQLRAEHALNSVASKEAAGLRNQVLALQQERDELQEKLQTASSIAAGDEDAIHTEARRLVQRAEQLVAEMQQNREEFTQSQEMHTRQLEEIRELERIFQKHEQGAEEYPEVSIHDLVAKLERLEGIIISLESERDALQGQIVGLQQQEAGLREEAEALRRETADMQGQLAQKTDAILKLDLDLEDARKRETMAEVRVNDQFQRYEARIAELEDANQELRRNESHLYGELQRFDDTLKEATSWIRTALAAYQIEQDCKSDSPELALDFDMADVDTLEGAALLERLEREAPLPEVVMGPIEDEPTVEIADEDDAPDAVVPSMPVSTLHHVEEIKQNINILMNGESSSMDDNTESDESL